MKINPIIQEKIAKQVLLDNAEREAREPSGRLSASRLGWPLQWQVLHHLKVPQKPMEEYTLRKFARGNDVEERIMKWLAPGPDKMQVPVTYRGVTGFMDVMLEYPIEVKSVTNIAFKFRQKEGPSRGHKLQAELYAVAKGFDKFGIAYVASDDYRVLCFEEPVTGDVDKVIDAYEAQLALKKVPVFSPMEKWQGMAEYSVYPDWMNLNEEQIEAKLIAMGLKFPKPIAPPVMVRPKKVRKALSKKRVVSKKKPRVIALPK